MELKKEQGNISCSFFLISKKKGILIWVVGNTAEVLILR